MNNVFFRVGLGALLVTIIIFMTKQISFIFNPLILLFKTVAMPFLIAGILYYMFLPAFKYLIKKKLNKNLAILSMFGLFASVITGGYFFIVPILKEQIQNFIESVPQMVKSAEGFFAKITNNDTLLISFFKGKVDLAKLSESVLSKADDVLIYIGNNILNIASTVTGMALIVIVVPIVFYYLLKDGENISDYLTKPLNKKMKVEVKKMLSDINLILSSYIQGQLLICFFVGVFVYVGFLIIGLKYPLMLALIAMVTNLIPFVGPFIGLVFSLAIGLTQSFNMAIGVVVVILVVQQIESNTITPYIMGKKLDMHPLTIIFALLFAGNVSGILGMLVAVPAYAVAKSVVLNLFRIYKLRAQRKKNDIL